MNKKKLPDRISSEEGLTLRPMNPGAEKWLHRPVKCLDFGFVYLCDYMGSDNSIAQAARVSYGAGTKQVSEDATLIRHLMRHAHTSPLEMCELKFHCKMPIFVARQWIRHRTANVNEYSGRYSEMINEFYLPDPSVLKKQSQTNKQGRSDEELTPEQQTEVLRILRVDSRNQFGNYKKMLDLGLSRELARIGLSVSNYTQWYWKIDLHNLFHFLRLRLDSHAQYEIRVFGEAMAEIVKDAFPISYGAFEDYRLNAKNFSGPELELLNTIITGNYVAVSDSKAVIEKLALARFNNKRETGEFLEKLKLIGILKK